MKKLVLLTSALVYAQTANAGLIQFFKDEQGNTNWQYVANFSSSVLIVLLSITAVSLFISHRRARRANMRLQEIRDELEDTVQKRTATLNESNRLLKETNLLLEGEIAHHKETASLLRSSEAYIKNILESMPLMLVGLNKEMQITQWNKLAEEYTGIPSAEVIGQNLWQAYPTITVAREQITEVLQEQKSITINQSQRGQYYYDITIYPLQGHVETGVVILIDDVTQRTLAENMLIQRDKMSSMGELASTMAHDIDIPLQVILKNLQAVHDQLKNGMEVHPEMAEFMDTDSTSKLLNAAAEKGRQASGVIANLLNFAHDHGDEKRLAYIPDVVDHSIALARDIISSPSGLSFRDISIEKNYEINLPEVPSYVSELQQVFLSLFRHACHALGQISRPDFKPLLRIEISERYDALWIKIQHNGVGLTSEEQQDIFEPFFQNTSAGKESDGEKRLSFSYFIITGHHQGQMAITSDLNVGTTFHMQLQLK